MRGRAFAQPLQRRPIGEHEQLAAPRHCVGVGVADRPYRAYLEAMQENVRDKGRQLFCRLHARLQCRNVADSHPLRGRALGAQMSRLAQAEARPRLSEFPLPRVR